MQRLEFIPSCSCWLWLCHRPQGPTQPVLGSPCPVGLHPPVLHCPAAYGTARSQRHQPEGMCLLQHLQPPPSSVSSTTTKPAAALNCFGVSKDHFYLAVLKAIVTTAQWQQFAADSPESHSMKPHQTQPHCSRFPEGSWALLKGIKQMNSSFFCS